MWTREWEYRECVVSVTQRSNSILVLRQGRGQREVINNTLVLAKWLCKHLFNWEMSRVSVLPTPHRTAHIAARMCANADGHLQSKNNWFTCLPDRINYFVAGNACNQNLFGGKSCWKVIRSIEVSHFKSIILNFVSVFIHFKSHIKRWWIQLKSKATVSAAGLFLLGLTVTLSYVYCILNNRWFCVCYYKLFFKYVFSNIILRKRLL